ncbi:hypothetical protein ACO0K9_09615 [Undibacterium sp. Ji50W]|uniref:hypothetical protein n=1 Tax=Undibacterium sp. Ji50W TaxID=3413041 RepID=UPI003BF0E572
MPGDQGKARLTLMHSDSELSRAFATQPWSSRKRKALCFQLLQSTSAGHALRQTRTHFINKDKMRFGTGFIPRNLPDHYRLIIHKFTQLYLKNILQEFISLL